MFENTDTHQPKLFAGLVGIVALTILTGCAAEEPAEEPPADQQSEESVQPDDASQEPTDTGTTGETEGSDESATARNDAVYNVIDAVETEYADGFIVGIDHDDDDDTNYDVEVVDDNELYELAVTADGSITVEERESDDEAIAEAEQATVPVTEALDQAFEEHADASFDQIELDDDDGSLHWQIDLDGADNEEIELDIPATS